MIWLVLISAAIIIFAAENILDKFIVYKELKDPLLLTVVFGLVLYIFYILFAVFFGSVFLPLNLALLGIIAGALATAGIALYYYIMQKEEVSTFVTILALEPLVVTLVSFFLFRERLTAFDYVGIVLLVSGAILISHKKQRSSAKTRLLILSFLAMFIFSVRNIIFKYEAAAGAQNAVFFWFGLGGLIVAAVLYAIHHPHIRARAKRGAKHVAMLAVLGAFGLLFFTKAIAVGSVSLTTAFLSAKPLVVLIMVAVLSSFRPKIVSEKFSRVELIKKISAGALIVAGCGMIVL